VDHACRLAPLQLSLFDGPAAVPQPPQPPQPAPQPVASPASPAPSTTPPHDGRSRRELLLGGQRVGYALRRTRRRSIGFVVDASGLTVSAPRWVGVAEIEAALQSKSRWVLRQLHEHGERQRRLHAQRIEWRDGATLPFLGEPVTIRLDPQAAGAVFDVEAGDVAGLGRRQLRLGLPAQAEPAQIRDLVHGWLQRQALRLFGERCRVFEARLGVRVTRLSLSHAQTRWGSAGADGAVRLHWRLIHLPLSSIDYVVAHELAHLREMNHGPAFWDLVRGVLPDVTERRRALREARIPPPD
jgi:predicted metal-dependent hydrolase